MSKIKNNIPQHIKDKIWEEIKKEIPYSIIAVKWQTSKSSVSRIKREYEKVAGIEITDKPISTAERQRREKIGKSAVTVAALRKAEFISQGFLNAFEVISYNAGHLIEVIDHSRDEADSLKAKQEEILEYFNKLIDTPAEEGGDQSQKESDWDLRFAMKQSIQKINDFFTRDMIRIKAVGEMRKQLEMFLKLKAEIMDIQTIKKILDAFFNGCDELDDAHYIKYRDKVIELAPATKTWFIQLEGSEDVKSLIRQE